MAFRINTDTCGRLGSESCADCGATLCSRHSEACELCLQVFCECCLYFHSQGTGHKIAGFCQTQRVPPSIRIILPTQFRCFGSGLSKIAIISRPTKLSRIPPRLLTSPFARSLTRQYRLVWVAAERREVSHHALREQYLVLCQFR